MDDRFKEMASEVFDTSTLLTARENIDRALGFRADKLAKLKLTPIEKKWIKQTQGGHADPILELISQSGGDLQSAVQAYDVPMLFIGDIHGACRPQYLDLVKGRSPKPSIQVGDLALGYPGMSDLEVVAGARFIRGNHDNPDACRQHPNYLGDFGYWEEEGIFFISGANSIDRDGRTAGFDLWYDEELNYRQWNEALELYGKVRPRKVVAHDGPVSVLQRFWPQSDFASGTAYGLQALLDVHRPALFVFGHHHKLRRETVKGTHFVCLGCRYTETELEDGTSRTVQTGFDTFDDGD